jgi:hypothetical protein
LKTLIRSLFITIVAAALVALIPSNLIVTGGKVPGGQGSTRPLGFIEEIEDVEF